MVDNGLIWADEPGKALTGWMPLSMAYRLLHAEAIRWKSMLFWYNAICYTLKLAGQAGDNKFVKEWKDMPDKVKRKLPESILE